MRNILRAALILGTLSTTLVYAAPDATKTPAKTDPKAGSGAGSATPAKPDKAPAKADPKAGSGAGSGSAAPAKATPKAK